MLKRSLNAVLKLRLENVISNLKKLLRNCLSSIVDNIYTFLRRNLSSYVLGNKNDTIGRMELNVKSETKTQETSTLYNLYSAYVC